MHKTSLIMYRNYKVLQKVRLSTQIHNGQKEKEIIYRSISIMQRIYEVFQIISILLKAF